MNEELEHLWQEAARNPGKPIDIGRIVVCDLCMIDYTDSPAVGGVIFESKAVCPQCCPRCEREPQFIRARCPPFQTFADFVREYRGSNTTITIHRGP